MKEIVTDLNQIKYKSNQKERENLEFRKFLKAQKSDSVDKIVHKLYRNISDRINCMECGNCCKKLRPGLTEKEVKRLAHIENIPKQEFLQDRVEKSELNDKIYLKAEPCKYLQNKKCSIYPDRPQDCREYPYLLKDNFISRTYNVLRNYKICPIVFNVVEKMKDKLEYSKDKSS